MAYRITACDEELDYRYSLTVETDMVKTNRLVIVQCNPSRASATRSDPTVGKVSNWAEQEGFSTVTFLNLFARRSPTVPEISHLHYSDLIGPKNDKTLMGHRGTEAKFVFAWGATLPVPEHLYLRRIEELHNIFEHQPIFRVGALSSGRYPRHGRMWNQNNRSIGLLSWKELLPSK